MTLKEIRQIRMAAKGKHPAPKKRQFRSKKEHAANAQ